MLLGTAMGAAAPSWAGEWDDEVWERGESHRLTSNYREHGQHLRLLVLSASDQTRKIARERRLTLLRCKHLNDDKRP